MTLFGRLSAFAAKPLPFEHYTSAKLWNDSHISKGMLEAHLDPALDLASFRRETIEKSVAWLASRFGIRDGTRICDFGCGPGLWTTRFARLGASVTGVDLSARSLNYARTWAEDEGLNITYINADYLEAGVEGPFDIVSIINCDFSVLSPTQVSKLLSTFRACLANGGAIVFDVDSMKRFEDAREYSEYEYHPEGGFFSAGAHHVITHHFKYDDVSLLCDSHTVICPESELRIYTWSQCYDRESIGRVLEQAGFRVARTYADFEGARWTAECRRIVVVAARTTGL